MDLDRNHIPFCCLLLLSLGVASGVTIKELFDETVNQGDTVELDCEIQNLGTSRTVFVFWYHDGSVVSVNTDLAVINPNYRLDTSVSGHWKVTIMQAQIGDQGMWKCQVQGAQPQPVSQQMTLVVLAPPVIDDTTRDMAPMPGSTVTLWCNATGSPEPSITWNRQRPAGNLPSGVQYITGNPLVITEITNAWRGLYQCFAANGIGQGTVTKSVFLQMEYSPVVRALTELATAPIGYSAHLTCIGESFPAVTNVDKVKWLKDDRLIEASEGYQMSLVLDTQRDPYRETSIATLIVTSVKTDDLATYTCRFENLLGSAEASVELEVGKQVDPETGKSRSKASTVMAAATTSLAAVTVATMLMQL